MVRIVPAEMKTWVMPIGGLGRRPRRGLTERERLLAEGGSRPAPNQSEVEVLQEQPSSQKRRRLLSWE